MVKGDYPFHSPFSLRDFRLQEAFVTYLEDNTGQSAV